MKRYLFSFVLLIISCTYTSAQTKPKLTQTIRGVVIDKETQVPIPGVNIVVVNSDPQKGTVTNENGLFRLENVEIGRQALQVSSVGYKTQSFDNIVLVSAKETVMRIELEESVTSLDEVVVKANVPKDQAINKMATISARSFTVDETSRYPGSYGDPARMAANYAGVMSVRDNRNDIVIRGNSSTGLLWRLDGVEIPNPNHFAASGTTGGPITILNNNLLTNSDFLTGAFPAEYGNALAGVFDLKMRTGNNEKREYWLELGYNGLEFGTEGPFSSNNKASYLVAYRYSMVDILDLLGAEVETTKYQDLTVKLNFPTSKGRWTLLGVGGTSYIEMFDSNDKQGDWTFDEWGEDLSNGSQIGAISLTNLQFLTSNTRIQTSVSLQGSEVTTKIDTFDLANQTPFLWAGEKSSEVKASIGSQLNSKLNSKNNLSLGFILDRYYISFADSSISNGIYDIDTDISDQFNLYQLYTQLKHQFTDDIELYLGLHGQFLDLNNTYAIEPRFGFSWDVNEKNTIKLGYGLHAQMQLRAVYFAQSKLTTGEYITTNKNLDFSKSHQIVLGYDHLFSESLRFKFETYYQYLYDIPVKQTLPQYSVLNFGAEYFIERIDSLENKGTGENYGVELTLERFLKNDFYFLITASLYNSTYTGYDKIERNTAFNGQFAFNALAGYEIRVYTNNVITLGLRTSYAGGRPYVPFDVDETLAQKQEVLDWDNAYTLRPSDYFRVNLRVGYKRNRKKFSIEYAMDLQYRTNYTSVYERRIDPTNGKVYNNYEMALYPMALWRIQF